MFTTIVKYHSLSKEDRDTLGTVNSEAPETTIALAARELRMIESALRLAVVLGVMTFTALMTHLFFDPLTPSLSSLVNFVSAFFVAIIPNFIVFIFLLAISDKIKRIYIHQSEKQSFVVSIHKLWQKKNDEVMNKNSNST
jgi:L-cystine uptake protein TcyP (sodium:dicarboxylate symporter family)